MMIMMSFVTGKCIQSVSNQSKIPIHHLCQFAAWREKPHGGVEMLVACTVLEHVKDDVGEGGNGEEEEASQYPPFHLPPSTDCLKIHVTMNWKSGDYWVNRSKMMLEPIPILSDTLCQSKVEVCLKKPIRDEAGKSPIFLSPTAEFQVGLQMKIRRTRIKCITRCKDEACYCDWWFINLSNGMSQCLHPKQDSGHLDPAECFSETSDNSFMISVELKLKSLRMDSEFFDRCKSTSPHIPLIWSALV